MAGETTTTTITEIVNSEWIDDAIGDYMIDSFVLAGPELCKVADLRGKHTKTYTFAYWEKDTGADIGTEGTTTLSANDMTLAEVQATCAQVGILREPTKLAERTSMVDLEQRIVEADGDLCVEMAEDDLAALFASITLSVGATGVNVSVANLVEALAKRRTAKANGAPAFVFDDQQVSDLTGELTTTTGVTWTAGHGQSLLAHASEVNGRCGEFLGVPCYYTNLTDTANAGADVVGALLNVGGKNPSMAMAVIWMPELDKELNVAKSTRLYAINMCYGVALINDAPSVKIVTDA